MAAMRALAKREQQSVQLLQVRYVLERFLARLERSRYRDKLILKGSMLMATWSDVPHRPTKDLDLLGFTAAPDELRDALLEIFALDANDVVRFDGK